MSRLMPKKHKALKGINDILILKLVGVGGNSTRSFLIHNINITVYIFSGIIVIKIINLERATSRSVPIKYIKVGNYKH